MSVSAAWHNNHIFYVSNHNNPEIFDLWHMDINGQNPVNLTKSINGSLGLYALSPDKKWVIFSKTTTDLLHQEIWLLNLETNALITFDKSYQLTYGGFAWSPDS